MLPTVVGRCSFPDEEFPLAQFVDIVDTATVWKIVVLRLYSAAYRLQNVLDCVIREAANCKSMCPLMTRRSKGADGRIPLSTECRESCKGRSSHSRAGLFDV